MILIPVILVTGLSFSQEPNRDTAAEELFNNYHGWGPSVGFDYMFVTGKPTQGVVVDYLSPKPVNFGFNWNFYHKNNLSLRLGGYYRFYSETYNEFYPAVETPVDFDFEIEWSESPYENAKINLTAEYIYPLNHRWGLNVGLGWEALYYLEDLTYEPGSVGLGEVKLIEYVSNSARTNWYFGPNVELGLDLKTRDFLYRLKLMYHYNASAPQYKRTVVAQNMQQTPDNVSVQTLTGSYVGFTLNAYPARSLFKRKTVDVKEAIIDATPVRKMFREDYMPFALAFGIDFLKVDEDLFPPPFQSDMNLSPALNIGLNWHYFNPGRFSFRLGALYRSYKKTADIFVPAETSGTSTDASFSFKGPRIATYRINQMFEYHLRLSDKTSLVPALGIELQYTGRYDEKEAYYAIEGETLVGVFDDVFSFHLEDVQIYSRAELGLNVKFNDFLLRGSLIYAPNIAYYNDALTTVVVNRQTGDVYEKLDWVTASYWGFGVSIYPGRHLFSKRK